MVISLDLSRYHYFSILYTISQSPYFSSKYQSFSHDTADGRNPAPVDRWFIRLKSHYLQCFMVAISYPAWRRISQPSTESRIYHDIHVISKDTISIII